MHILKPNGRYKIVTLQVAAPVELDDAEITDRLGEMMRRHVAVTEKGNGVVADWQFVPPRENFPEIQVSDDPEEGEPFTSFDLPP